MTKVGYKQTEEHKEKTRQRMLGENNQFFGRTHSEESRKAQSIGQKKRFEDPEERAKVSRGQKKHYEDPEERCKISERQMGEKNHFYNKKHSLATRDVMSDLAKKRYEDLEERKKISGSNHPNWIKDRELVAKNRVAYGHVLSSLNLPFGSKVQRESRPEVLGYSDQQFFDDFESKFYNDMTWQDWGNHEGLWQRHHKIQIPWFFEFGIYDIKIINALPILLPLWFDDHCQAQRVLNKFTKEERKFWVHLFTFYVEQNRRKPLSLSEE